MKEVVPGLIECSKEELDILEKIVSPGYPSPVKFYCLLGPVEENRHRITSWDYERDMPNEYTIMRIAKSGEKGQRVLDGYIFEEDQWELFSVSIYDPNGRKVYHFNAYCMSNPNFTADPKVKEDLFRIMSRWENGLYHRQDIVSGMKPMNIKPPTLWERLVSKFRK